MTILYIRFFIDIRSCFYSIFSFLSLSIFGSIFCFVFSKISLSLFRYLSIIVPFLCDLKNNFYHFLIMRVSIFYSLELFVCFFFVLFFFFQMMNLKHVKKRSKTSVNLFFLFSIFSSVSINSRYSFEMIFFSSNY